MRNESVTRLLPLLHRQNKWTPLYAALHAITDDFELPTAALLLDEHADPVAVRAAAAEVRGGRCSSSTMCT